MVDYKAEEFTLLAYEELLKLAKSRYAFRSYTDYSFHENFVLWRHDVDFSLEQALILAKIEHKHHVSSIYFLHFHNEFYNLFDHNSLSIVKKILELGHSIGLHFEIGYYNLKSSKDLIKWLQFEKSILETIFSTPVAVFSFHNTNELSNTFEEHTYAEMINTYSRVFKTEVTYCSDSNGYWRYKKLYDVLNDDTVKCLQVLTHPDWWSVDEMMPRHKILGYAEKRMMNMMSHYDQILAEAGRLNLGLEVKSK